MNSLSMLIEVHAVGGASALELYEARSAPNETIEVLQNQSQGYMVQLDVFHQLHCLVGGRNTEVDTPKVVHSCIRISFVNLSSHSTA
jgi:hypothetical protein